MTAEHDGVVHEAPTRRRADEVGLVLEALGIPYEARHEGGRWLIGVPWQWRDAAVQAIAAYDREQPIDPHPPRVGITLLGVHVGVLLTAVAVVTGPRAGGGPWFERGSARAAAIMAGEPWRAITALTLHADAEHLIGNTVLGIVILGALGGVWGWGVGLLFTVASGGLGNLVNAWLRGMPHDAVGASTALFGAIGVLGGTGLVERRRIPFSKPWVSVAGALGLLAMLGAGEGTDVLAHLFGLLVGLTIGTAASMLTGRPRRGAQWVAGVAAIATVAVGWALAFAT